MVFIWSSLVSDSKTEASWDLVLVSAMVLKEATRLLKHVANITLIVLSIGLLLHQSGSKSNRSSLSDILELLGLFVSIEIDLL